MSVSGPDFNEKFSGTRGSSMSAGVFVDGYYNLGWPGLIVAALSYGWVLRVCAAISESIVRTQTLWMYPLTFIGVAAGLRPDSSWLGVVGGSLVIAVSALAIFAFLSNKRFQTLQYPE